jgi:type I restriction enzyme M protein
MLIKGQDITNIVQGNTLSDDGHPTARFDYMLSNPPFGVEWKKVRKRCRTSTCAKAMTAALAPACRACRMARCCSSCTCCPRCARGPRAAAAGIVLNGSPLFTGGAGSGESEIRRYVLENDLVEAIVALPTDMFYNTGIATYVWILSNKKPQARTGKVQLIDASSFGRRCASPRLKRKEMGEGHIEDVTRLFGSFVEAQLATVLDASGKGSRARSSSRARPSPRHQRAAR